MQNVDERPRDIVLPFDSAFASSDCLERAALKFSGLCAFSFNPDAKGTTVTLSFPFAHQVAVDELVGRYRNEVIDQVLRERIANETAEERNLILAYAFSNTKLIGQ